MHPDTIRVAAGAPRLERRGWLRAAGGVALALLTGAARAQPLPTLPALRGEGAPEAPPAPSEPASVAQAARSRTPAMPSARDGASLRIGLPYTPSEEVVALVDGQPTWMEVYGCPPAQVRRMLASLRRGEIPTTTLAIGVIEALNLQVGGIEVRLPQRSASLTRGGRPVIYDEQCAVRPRTGDLLQVRYEREGLAVGLRATLVSAVSLGLANPFAEELSELDTSRAEHCKAEVEQRLYYAGRLELFQGARRLDARDVLVQTIAEL